MSCTLLVVVVLEFGYYSHQRHSIYVHSCFKMETLNKYTQQLYMHYIRAGLQFKKSNSHKE